MDLKVCEASSNLNGDVLLPPRKRLLADLKRQSSNGTSDSTVSNEFNARMTKIMKDHFDGNPNVSAQEIIDSSKTAAEVAIRIAESARARAEDKAVMAMKAIAAAKKALELVATIEQEEEEEEENTSCSSQEKKEFDFKHQKHVPVHLLYQNDHCSEEDEEQIAFRFHKNTNKSPVMANRIPNNLLRVEKNKHKNPNPIQISIEEQESGKKSPSSAAKTTIVKKRGRARLKRLPLSICAFRDRVNRNEKRLNLETCID